MVQYAMEMSVVQFEHFFETIAATDSAASRGQYRCSACGVLGHNKRSRVCSKFIFSSSGDNADETRRAQLMQRYKVRIRLAGRLKLLVEEGDAISQVSAIYVESETRQFCLNTGSSHISFADKGEGVVHLTSMHLDKDYQNKGYGSLVLGMMHHHWLTVGKFNKVIINNASSIGRRFYVKMGYKKDAMGDWIFNL